MESTTPTTIIVLSGQTGAGKTSLAKDLVQKLNANFASFGSFVRSEAMRRGIERDRVSLQNLGQKLIDEYGPDEFVNEVLICGQGNGSTTTVLDGVRSVEIWQSVQKLVAKSILIYLEVDENERIDRLTKREKLDVSPIQLAMHHPMETNIPELRAYADLVLQNNLRSEMVLEVMNLLTLKKFAE